VRAWAFDTDGAGFKLGVEAYRITQAALFDPMMAVHTANVEPLPHQISAVYEGEKQTQSASGNYFDERDQLICRLDQISRNEVQVWLSLLDGDRFYGKFREGAHKLMGGESHQGPYYLRNPFTVEPDPATASRVWAMKNSTTDSRSILGMGSGSMTTPHDRISFRVLSLPTQPDETRLGNYSGWGINAPRSTSNGF